MSVVRWLAQMRHLVNDNVFEKVLRFLDEFCVKPDMPGTVVATSPLSFHPLQHDAAQSVARISMLRHASCYYGGGRHDPPRQVISFFVRLFLPP